MAFIWYKVQSAKENCYTIPGVKNAFSINLNAISSITLQKEIYLHIHAVNNKLPIIIILRLRIRRPRVFSMHDNPCQAWLSAFLEACLRCPPSNVECTSNTVCVDVHFCTESSKYLLSFFSHPGYSIGWSPLSIEPPAQASGTRLLDS